jgi:hypothetical protein
MAEHPRDPRVPRATHPESDVDVGRIVWFAVALTIIIVIIGLAAHVSLSIADRTPRGNARSPLAQDRPAPGPRLQASPPADMAAFRAHEDAILSSAGWIDEAAGIARIPIEVAKSRLLEKGLPSDAAAPAPGGNP